MKEENKKERPTKQAKEKKKFLVWPKAVSIVLILVVGTYFLISCNPGESPESREKISLGVSKSFLSIPVYIAKEQGFFAKEGLDITIKEYSSGKLATKGLFAGEVDISTAADMPVVINSFKREDFHIFATFAHSYHMVKMIARKDNGIKEGADLKGRKVAVNMGTSSHFFLAAFLLHNELSPSEIEMVNTKTVNMPAALNNNEVDAISVWQPHIQAAKKLLQDKAIELPSSEIYRTTFNLVVMKSFSEGHPEILKRILRALDRAVVFIKTNRDKSQNIIAQSFKLDKDGVNAVWDDFKFGLSLDQTLLVTWDEMARWAIKNKRVDKNNIPNYLDFINVDMLEAVKPETITIIR
ncbi:MAG: NrtA/SsuA/CpmA family ABC transporter substrate-binding protein [Deltaproteobacteria bacterium]|nr:NrtA/SsuA/CpmA family ABC transporter substrate-binding protein [Deltaproteobacteria bacterium]